MDIAAGIGIAIGLTGLGSAVAVVKYNVKGDIKSLKERSGRVESRVETLEESKKNTREFIIRSEERERHREERETDLVKSLAASLVSTERIATGFHELSTSISQFLKIDITSTKRRVDCHDKEIENMARQIKASGIKK